MVSCWRWLTNWPTTLLHTTESWVNTSSCLVINEQLVSRGNHFIQEIRTFLQDILLVYNTNQHCYLLTWSQTLLLSYHNHSIAKSQQSLYSCYFNYLVRLRLLLHFHLDICNLMDAASADVDKTDGEELLHMYNRTPPPVAAADNTTMSTTRTTTLLLLLLWRRWLRQRLRRRLRLLWLLLPLLLWRRWLLWQRLRLLLLLLRWRWLRRLLRQRLRRRRLLLLLLLILLLPTTITGVGNGGDCSSSSNSSSIKPVSSESEECEVWTWIKSLWRQFLAVKVCV